MAWRTRVMSKDRPARGSHKPGSHWWYNNWDVNTAGVVFEHQTGERIFEAFGKAIADPFEQEDLWKKRPEVVKSLLGELERIKQLDKSDEIRWQQGESQNRLIKKTQ